MKSRRVLQVFVAALSIILLACMALFAAILYLGTYVSFIPNELTAFGTQFKAGMQTIADRYTLDNVTVPAAFFAAPGLMLLLAVILILSKNKGKDGKNIAGCVFALIGTFALTAFMLVFANDLYTAGTMLIACCVSAGVLALFLIFVGCALGVKPKKVAPIEEDEVPVPASAYVVDDEETVAEMFAAEEEEETDATEPVASEEVETSEEEEVASAEEIEELKSEIAIGEKVRAVEEEEEEDESVSEQDSPATQYVPHENVSIRDVVDKTYGKEGDALSAATLQKINLVRSLYESNAITEEEYIKLINKYLGF